MTSCSSISENNFITKCGKKYVFEELDIEDRKIIKEIIPKHLKLERLFTVNGFLQSHEFLDAHKDYLNMKIRDDDVWIASFPRSGTTWTAEMVWCILNNLDFEAAHKKSLIQRVPFIDYELQPIKKLLEMMQNENKNCLTIKNVEQLPSPRIFWVHSPYTLLPLELQNGKTNAKIIYALRDPRDVCLSFYHYFINITNTPITFDHFSRLFLNSNAVFYGPYWKHVESYLKEKNNPNVYICSYDEKIKDLKSAIRNMLTFLDKKLTEEEINKLHEHIQFDKMKDNPQVNGNEKYARLKRVLPYIQIGIHIREGKSGEGKNKMSPDIAKKFEEKMAQYKINVYL